MLRVMNFSLGVEIMLLRRSLTVRRSADGVPQSSGQLTRFPPIVMCVLYLSFLPMQNTHTLLAYVSLPLLSSCISSSWTKKMVSAVVVRRGISVPNDLVHMSLYLGYFMRWWYSRRSPVLLLRTAYAGILSQCCLLCHDRCLVSWCLHEFQHEVPRAGSYFLLLFCVS